MRILFLGDIVGRPGRLAVCALLPQLLHRRSISFVVANCENVSSGAGVKPEHARMLLEAGADILTSGNHIWRFREVVPYIRDEPRLLRPANFPEGTAGRGWVRVETPGGAAVTVINLMGRVFMDAIDCPFRAADRILAEQPAGPAVIVVDMHAEATSEKGAMGHHLDGRVSAVVGSHTHVQTADEGILPQGTAFHTDAGMCGPVPSVIGVKPEVAVHRFVSKLPVRFETAKGAAIVQGTIIDVDPATGRATHIERLQEQPEGA